MYYYFFEKSRDMILKSKARIAAAAATTATATIAQGGALSTLESMLAGLIAGELLRGRGALCEGAAGLEVEMCEIEKRCSWSRARRRSEGLSWMCYYHQLGTTRSFSYTFFFTWICHPTTFLPGTATSIITNPIWVINTRQTVRVAPANASPSSSQTLPAPATQAKGSDVARLQPVKRLSFLQTVQHIMRTDGIAAFWRGLGPALVLVINPILQVRSPMWFSLLLCLRKLTDFFSNTHAHIVHHL